MIRPFKSLLSAALVACLIAFGASPQPASAQQGLNADQRKAVEEIVRDYIVKNPEIIKDALVELERRGKLAELEAQRQVVISEKAVIFDSPNHAVVGNPQGDVTIVEFFDYNCGYCKTSLEVLRTLTSTDTKLRIILKDFPILGPDSLEASRVAVAAKKQLNGAKYWDFHFKLMSQRGRINGEKALEAAKEMGADVARLRKDMEAPETKAAIAETISLGDRLGIEGTPAFILGDEVAFGALSAEAMKTRIASLRKCGKSAC
ncbi:MAG: DsbA family protein [Bosea sp. (in: a-proteobacteria)]